MEGIKSVGLGQCYQVNFDFYSISNWCLPNQTYLLVGKNILQKYIGRHMFYWRYKFMNDVINKNGG